MPSFLEDWHALSAWIERMTTWCFKRHGEGTGDRIQPSSLRIGSLGLGDEEIRALAKNLIDSSLPGHAKWNMSLFNCPPTPIAAFGDMLLTLIDTNCASYVGRERFGAIERALVGYVAERLGCVPSDGLFVPSGTYANLQALVLHRDSLRRGTEEIVVLSSDESHFSIARAVSILGHGVYHEVVPTDRNARILVNALDDALHAAAQQDRAAIVVSTFGTTYSGSIDPIGDIDSVCKRHGAKHHVDAAYGGALALSGSFSPYQQHFASVDSVTIDFHKWWYVPNTTSLLLFRDRHQAASSFAIEGWCSNTELPLEPYLHGIQVSRRADFVKVLLNLQYYGTERLAAMIDENMACAQELRKKLEASGLEVFPGSDLSLVACRVPNTEPRDPIYKLVESALLRRGMITSNTLIKGREWWRFCFTSYHVNRADVAEIAEVFLDELSRHGQPSRSG
jgi:glutamate/tyrosine decarboxylase-like PLP-dependent enzyme